MFKIGRLKRWLEFKNGRPRTLRRERREIEEEQDEKKGHRRGNGKIHDPIAKRL